MLLRVVCTLIVLDEAKRLKGLAAYEELAKGFAALAGTAVWVGDMIIYQVDRLPFHLST